MIVFFICPVLLFFELVFGGKYFCFFSFVLFSQKEKKRPLKWGSFLCFFHNFSSFLFRRLNDSSFSTYETPTVFGVLFLPCCIVTNGRSPCAGPALSRSVLFSPRSPFRPSRTSGLIIPTRSVAAVKTRSEIKKFGKKRKN